MIVQATSVTTVCTTAVSVAGGKSAIMAGIVVALGGKATTTLRASSLKQFIRTGCT